MEEFKVGGKITLSENEKYIIVDIVEYKGKKFYFCSTANKPIIPVIFEKANINGKTFIKQVEDKEIIKYIANKILSEE